MQNCISIQLDKKEQQGKIAIDVISCGYNALDIIYELLDDTGICIIQHHIPTHKCKWSGQIQYDDEFIGTPLELMLHFMGIGDSNDK